MKKIIYLIACVFLVSCSKENLYDFKDLTNERDYIYLVKFYAKDSSEPSNFTIRVFETNGYNEVISYPYSSSTAKDSIHVREFAVKGYRKNGVEVIPEQNIESVLVRLYEVGYGSSLMGLVFQHRSTNSLPIYVGYNFETNEKVIQQVE